MFCNHLLPNVEILARFSLGYNFMNSFTVGIRAKMFNYGNFMLQLWLRKFIKNFRLTNHSRLMSQREICFQNKWLDTAQRQSLDSHPNDKVIYLSPLHHNHLLSIFELALGTMNVMIHSLPFRKFHK